MFGKKMLITKYDFDRIQTYMNSLPTAEYADTIQKLKEKMKKAKLIASKEVKPTVITMNSKFLLKNLGNGLKQEYALVFPDERDPKTNKISIFDFIGAELFSHEVGEIIHCQSDEDAYYLIENVVYQPEAAGDYHL